MKKQEFMKMMVQDNETESEPKKSLYADVIDCMDIALSQSSDDTEIPGDKTVVGAFALIEKQGKASAAKCVGPFAAAEIIAEYLGVKYTRAKIKYGAATKAKKVSLEDFL